MLSKKIQSIDRKSVKLALRIPLHAFTVTSYREVGVVPLDDFRKLALATCFVQESLVENFANEELTI